MRETVDKDLLTVRGRPFRWAETWTASSQRKAGETSAGMVGSDLGSAIEATLTILNIGPHSPLSMISLLIRFFTPWRKILDLSCTEVRRIDEPMETRATTSSRRSSEFAEWLYEDSI